MRKTIDDRISSLRGKTIACLSVGVFLGLVGLNARAVGSSGPPGGRRRNAVLRLLFAAVIIDEHRGKRGSFDDCRTGIKPHPLSSELADNSVTFWWATCHNGGLAVTPV